MNGLDRYVEYPAVRAELVEARVLSVLVNPFAICSKRKLSLCIPERVNDRRYPSAPEALRLIGKHLLHPATVPFFVGENSVENCDSVRVTC